jgi:hypothetical protein
MEIEIIDSDKSISDEEFKANKEVYYKQGKEIEDKYQGVILDFFNINLDDFKIKKSRYNVIDWTLTNKKTNEVISIEVKSRTSVKDFYPDTIYGTNKFVKQLKGLYSGTIQHAYVVFVFTDGLFYYKLEKDSIKDVKFKDISTMLRGRRETANHCLIPVEILQTIKLI